MSQTDQHARFLAEVAPFSELDDDARQALAGQFKRLEFKAGETIGRYPQPGRHGLYVIAGGSVMLQTLPEGDETASNLEQRGEAELFGHRISLPDGVDDYQAVAVEDCRLLQLPAGDLDQAIRRHAIVGQFLASSPGERLRSLDDGPVSRLADLALRPPIVTGPERSIQDCARLMAEHGVSSLPVVSEEGLIGILTDRDLRSRVLARGVDPARPVDNVMTAHPAAIRVDQSVDEALVEMMRLGVHHLPIVDRDNGLLSVISAGDLGRLQAPHPLQLARDIQRCNEIASMAELARRGPGMLADLCDNGSQVNEVGRVATVITDACTRRLITLAQRELGPAPMEWTWLAFGSQARQEQGLISDQDNGLLMAEEPDAEASRYFEQLATFVCDGLNACGYVYCPGDVMAKGRWRMSLAAWRRTFQRWMREPDPQSVMNSSIFFDLRGVAGKLELAETLQREVLDQARQEKIFLRFLAAESIGHRPPLGLFRQFVQERDGGHSQGLNLKKRGVIPIVDLARVRALESAISAVHTEHRIQAAAEHGPMHPDDANDLMHALRFIGNVRLRHQVRLYRRGEKPNHLVDPNELSGLHRRYLRSAFGIVANAQKGLAQRYQV
ncbi:MAG: DUF294 nucleotidyltransferase-like domain-containing protein [Wenzhouxiangella sp.]